MINMLIVSLYKKNQHVGITTRRFFRTRLIQIMNNITENFRLPRYKEIPDIGLYLEQTVSYINNMLSIIDISITSSMLSNYVKKGYVTHPVRKKYYPDQISYIIFIVIVKQVLSMENISALFSLQKSTYPLPVAYDFFCSKLEKNLSEIYEGNSDFATSPVRFPFEKRIINSVITTTAQIIYLNDCFKNRISDSSIS